MLERLFSLDAKGTTAGREITAGATTFLTMAYIMFVNPMVLAGAGLDHNAVFVATCLSAAITTAAMGLYANLPVALAPGMGLNVYFAYIGRAGAERRLAARARLRGACRHRLCRDLAVAGPGLDHRRHPPFDEDRDCGGHRFLPRPDRLRECRRRGAQRVHDHPRRHALLAEDTDRGCHFRRDPGDVGLPRARCRLHRDHLRDGGGNPDGFDPQPAIASLPPSLAPTFLRLHFSGAAGGAIASIVFVFLLVELLDTSGTLTAVAQQSGLVDDKGRLLNARRALVCDAAGTIVGAALGTSPVTAYIESAAGIESGGRTGLTALTVSVLFLAGLFLSPLASAVPGYATAPALVFVAVLMAKGLKDIAWDDITEAAPALVTSLAIPFTFSIAAGVGIGFITYAALKIATGRLRELNPAVAAIALAFAVKIALT